MATMYYRPYTSQLLNDGDMPPYDAIESVLPEYKYIFVDPDSKDNAPGPSHINSMPVKPPDDLDKTSLGLLDYQMKELEKYRTAVHKMGQDIMLLRQQIGDLESQNSQLRRDLAHYNDATRLLLDSQELDGLSKPELAARYVSIKQKLSSQTSELKAYKERVLQLQNDLIKKNDKEKEYLQLSQAHLSQQDLLQKLQDKATKVKRLEEACRKQEKVIDKLEKLLDKATHNTGDSYSTEANEALLEENKRLRAELKDHKEVQSTKNKWQDQTDEDKLKLYEQLDRAVGRITSLEKQLAENARQWAREKSELKLKLGEATQGLQRTSPVYNSDFLRISARKFEEDIPFTNKYSKAPKNRKPARYPSSRLEPLRF